MGQWRRIYGIEQATIYAYMDTIWGNFSQIISPVPHENQVTINIPLPLVEITAIEPAEKESVIDTSLGVQIKLVNTGTADANVKIQCFVGERMHTSYRQLLQYWYLRRRSHGTSQLEDVC